MTEDEWIDNREIWWSRHFLQAGAEGARLPNLAFTRDDEKLVLNWEAPCWATQASPLVIHHTGTHAIPWRNGYEVIVEFIQQVGTWLEAEVGQIYHWIGAESLIGTLAERTELLTSRSVVNVVEILGLRGGLSELGLDEHDDPAASPELQVLRDSSPEVGSEIAAVLREISERTRGPSHEARLLRTRARLLAKDAARAAQTAEEQGQQAAIHLRRSVGLDSQPIPEIQPILERIGLTYEHYDVPSSRDRMFVMTRGDTGGMAGTVRTVRTERPWGQRFEAARAAGHVLLDPLREGALGAAGGPFAQRTRRRRSGAFAAELLLPASALAEAGGGVVDGAADSDRSQALLEEYGVGARTAAFQLWNRRWLSAPEVRDELIDRFAAVRWG